MHTVTHSGSQNNKDCKINSHGTSLVALKLSQLTRSRNKNHVNHTKSSTMESGKRLQGAQNLPGVRDLIRLALQRMTESKEQLN